MSLFLHRVTYGVALSTTAVSQNGQDSLYAKHQALSTLSPPILAQACPTTRSSMSQDPNRQHHRHELCEHTRRAQSVSCRHRSRGSRHSLRLVRVGLLDTSRHDSEREGLVWVDFGTCVKIAGQLIERQASTSSADVGVELLDNRVPYQESRHG